MPFLTIFFYISAGFDELVLLRDLDLTGCMRLNMDKEIKLITKLRHLERLILWDTNITVLPMDIDQLVHLGEESMRGILEHCKRMPWIPSALFDHPYFSSITKLDLSGWCMTSLPERLGELKLTELIMKCCDQLKHEEALETISKMHTLTSLDLTGWYMHSLPTGFGDLNSLTDLNLFGCMSLQLPAHFGRLPQLRRLRLATPQASDEGTFTILADIATLTSLDLSNTKIQTLPDCVGKLVSLRELNLSNCRALETMAAGDDVHVHITVYDSRHAV